MEATGEFDEFMRSPSPVGSVISFRSSNAENLIRESGGRLLSSQNDTYLLPVDREEHARLEYQHRALTLTLDSLYAVPDLVTAAMTPSQKYSPAAVDIGAGSGQWTIEFAKEFPHASVVGIDLAPPATIDMAPPNCRFEVDDANLSLSHYAKSFNVCHMRCIDHGIYDYGDLLYRVAEILRTNGVLLLVAGDNRLYTENRTPFPVDLIEGQPGWSATQAMFWAVHNNSMAIGDSANAKYRWEEWLMNIPYYTSVGVEDVFIPIGPWMNGLDNRCTHIAQLMQINTKHILHAFKPLLLANGYDEVLIDRWEKTALKEVEEMKPRLFTRWRFGWAIRNSIKWVENKVPENEMEG